MNRSTLLALAVLFAAGTAHAAPAAAPPTAIEGLNAGLQQAQKDGTQPFAARYAALAPKIDAAFNLQQILQTIVGLRWTQFSDADKATLLAAFRAFTISSYVSNFNTDSGDAFRILPDSRDVGSDVVVETEIVPKQGDPVRIDYVMRNGTAGWQAVDVLQMGTISQAAVQRSDFRALLNDGGPSKLAASLKDKVSTMSGGSITP